MMKHAYTILGLLMLGIFLWRGAEAIARPGLGLEEIYVAGGVILALVLTAMGIRMHLAERGTR